MSRIGHSVRNASNPRPEKIGFGLSAIARAVRSGASLRIIHAQKYCGGGGGN